MSITKSYNKHTDTYYAYETTYEWNEKLQKKVQKKVCIGKYDPVTGEVIPNARRGRPSKKEEPAVRPIEDQPLNDAAVSAAVSEQIIHEINDIVSEMDGIHSELKLLEDRFILLENKLQLLQKEVLSRNI